jgi:Chaperone of endosialidase
MKHFSIGLIVIAALAAVPLIHTRTATLAQRTPPVVEKPDSKKVEGQLPEPIVLGTSAQTVQIPGSLNVGNGRMEVVTSAIGGGVLTNNLYIRQLSQGSPAHVCWKVAPDHVPGLMLTTCTSSESSLRYKTDLRPFSGGLSLVARLKPYNFAWKNTGARELGLIAEDVAAAEPLLTYKNEKDEIEGVKYENLTVVLVNAIKEQQTQIEELRQQVRAQQEQLNGQGKRRD